MNARAQKSGSACIRAPDLLEIELPPQCLLQRLNLDPRFRNRPAARSPGGSFLPEFPLRPQ